MFSNFLEFEKVRDHALTCTTGTIVLYSTMLELKQTRFEKKYYLLLINCVYVDIVISEYTKDQFFLNKLFCYALDSFNK